jgi:Ser/Thr protein kinase RdoA (MazF antagonist)
MEINEILKAFGLSVDAFNISKITAGYINQTYKLSGKNSYVLQRINKNVFTQPDVIARNLRVASDYLRKNFSEYLFLSSIKTVDGKEMVYDAEGFPWRLFPYIDKTLTVNKVDTEEEAFNAAAGFSLLTRNLSEIDVSLFEPTIEKFQDLQWRWHQFETSLRNATRERKRVAKDAIEQCEQFSFLVHEYKAHINSRALKLRVVHNDTKINNILFDAETKKAVCVIDLDTLMPGYFIYDLGDMIRTFVSPVSEEERDVSKVIFRKNIYESLISGYLSNMGDKLTPSEERLIPFAGMMMTYIMATRMLTDFLNGNIYYQISYPEQNLVRANNQFALMNEFERNI